MANTGEYGLFQLIDIGDLDPSVSVTSVDSGLLQSAVLMDTSQHNADVAAVQNLFADPVTIPQESVTTQSSRRNQPVDENGRVIPIKPSVPYTVAYPLKGSGNAWGSNFVTRAQMTVGMLAQTMSAMFRGDLAWVEDQILAALYTNTNGGYTWNDPLYGALTVQGVANGDATTYYNVNTNSTATDNHYLAQTAAIADATNPFDDIYAELTEHPDNGGEVVAFIPAGLRATATGLAEFNSALVDPDITLSDTTDRLTGSLRAALPKSAKVLGKTDSGVWIVEWARVASNTIISITTEGPRPLARRMWPQSQLQGFFRAGERADFPHTEEQWQRWEGYGARNRTGAVLYQVSNGDTTYDIPSNMTAPIA